MSRLTDALDTIQAEFETITTGNGYNTDPAIIRAFPSPEAVSKYPTLFIFPGPLTITAGDDACTVWDMTAPIIVVGVIQGDTSVNGSYDLQTKWAELAQDMLKIALSMQLKYANATNSFIVLKSKNYLVDPVIPMEDNRAMFGMSMTIKIRSLDAGTDD